jgi:hypothetical protein
MFRHSRLLLSLFIVFLVLPSAVTMRTLVVLAAQLLRASKLFSKEGKQEQFFVDVRWMLTQSGYPPSAWLQPGLLVCIVVVLANGHTFRSVKRLHEKRKCSR